MQPEQTGHVESIFKQFEDRISALEAEVTRSRLAGTALNRQQVDAALRDLGEKMKDGKPQSSYFNTRFRSFEVALANIKVLASELAQRLRDERLKDRKVEVPARQVMRSKTCTQDDLESGWMVFWANEAKRPLCYRRKLWELAYVPQALWSAGKLVSNSRGLGFGCGTEPLPSLFAKYGATILATDLAADRPEAKDWSTTDQHASTAAAVRKKQICPDEKLLQNIEFKPVDMNNIDRDLDNSFDFCWSICALEHLGSIEKGFEFIDNSLRTLKPGGVAVHTLEFTFDTGPVRDNNPTVLFTKDRIIWFVDKLRRDGLLVADLDFSLGKGELDAYVDILNKYAHVPQTSDLPQLKLSINGYVCTSFGLIITVPSGQPS